MTIRFLDPLVEWHVHLDGSLLPETVLDIAHTKKITLKAFDGTEILDEDALRRAIEWDKHAGLDRNVLVPFGITTSVMQQPDDLARAAYELVEQWQKDGVLWGEMRFMPTLHLREGLTPDVAIESVLDGMKQGEETFGVRSGLIVCSMRHVPVTETRTNIEAAIRYRDQGVVAVDMAGDDRQSAIAHGSLFQWAARLGLECDIHCAEAGPPERIREAWEFFHASRGGHLIRAGESDDILTQVIATRFPFACCPTTNMLVGHVDSIANHPARNYLLGGAKISLHTDNRLMSNITLREEHQRVAAAWQLDQQLHEQLILNAIEGSFAPADVKADLFQHVTRMRS